MAKKYLGFLKHFRAVGVPVQKAIIENNMWIFCRPPKESIVWTLREIRSLGYELASGEMTVVVSDHDPVRGETVAGGSSIDREAIQAALYRDVLEAYLEVGGELRNRWFHRWPVVDRRAGDERNGGHAV